MSDALLLTRRFRPRRAWLHHWKRNHWAAWLLLVCVAGLWLFVWSAHAAIVLSGSLGCSRTHLDLGALGLAQLIAAIRREAWLFRGWSMMNLFIFVNFRQFVGRVCPP